MAKAHVYLLPGANVEATDTFASWVDTTNQLVYDMGTVVLTTAPYPQPNTSVGGYTTGNAHVQGVLSANTLVAYDALRGGSTSTSGNLIISSNTIFNESALVHVTANTENFTVNANNVNITSNVSISNTSKTVTISAANTTITDGNLYVRTSSELTGTRVDIDGQVLDVTSNTIIQSTTLNANVDLITLGFDSSDTLIVNGVADFNANVNVDGVFTVTANASFSNGNTAVTSLEASGEVRLKGNTTRTIKTQSTNSSTPTLNISLANTSSTITPMVISSTSVSPGADLVYDLGSSAFEWRKAWVKDINVANSAVIGADVDIGRDLVVRRDLYVYGNTLLSSNVTLTLNTSDIEELNVYNSLSMLNGAVVDTDVLPTTDTAVSLGSTTNKWSNVHSTNVYANSVVANTVTATLIGNATYAASAGVLQTARTINGVSFNGSANIIITANTNQSLSAGSYLVGSSFTGSTATTWSVDATAVATAGKVVARDASGNFAANTVFATSFAGNGANLTALNGSSITTGTVEDARIANTIVRTSRTISAGDGLNGGGSLGSDISFAVDTSVVRTSGSQTIAGTKSFSELRLSGTMLPSTNLVYNIGSSSAKILTVFANTFSGTATSAQYADLAENYLADEEYDVGTVVAVGGVVEITAANSAIGHSVIGVVSENPAFIMNSELSGGTAIALKGRVKVKVIGDVKKGDRLAASAISGFAEVDNNRSAWSFAIALEGGTDLVEAIIL